MHNMPKIGPLDMKTEKSYDFIKWNKSLIQDLKYARFYFTLILKDLIKNDDINEIATEYGTNHTTIQTLKNRILGKKVCNFWRELKWFNMYYLLEEFQSRMFSKPEADPDQAMDTQ